jgi:hypothetical protein
MIRSKREWKRIWFSSHPAMNSTLASSVSSSRAMASSRHRCRPPGSCSHQLSPVSTALYPPSSRITLDFPVPDILVSKTRSTVPSLGFAAGPQRCAERGRISRSQLRCLLIQNIPIWIVATAAETNPAAAPIGGRVRVPRDERRSRDVVRNVRGSEVRAPNRHLGGGRHCVRCKGAGPGQRVNDRRSDVTRRWTWLWCSS